MSTPPEESFDVSRWRIMLAHYPHKQGTFYEEVCKMLNKLSLAERENALLREGLADVRALISEYQGRQA